MLTKKNPYGLNPKLFFKRLTRNVSMGFLIILGSLGGGMLGYHHLIALSKEERKKGQYHLLSSLEFEDKEKKTAWLKDLSFPVAIVKRIFKNEGVTDVLYLVTHDLSSDADRIYEIYQKRWRIEKYHKSIKQNTSLKKSPTRVVRSQKNHIFASIIAYCKLEFLKTKTSLNHFALKYKLILKANQMAFNELKTLREGWPCVK